MADEKDAVAKGRQERQSGGQNAFQQEQEAPVSTRGRQLGEAPPKGGVTTRVPRGVGEPPADQVAEGEGGVALTQNSVQRRIQEETEKGYRGQVSDPTPNEAYTVAGVTRGDSTPETTVFTPRGQ